MIIFFIVSYDTQRELVRMRDTMTVRNKMRFCYFTAEHIEY